MPLPTGVATAVPKWLLNFITEHVADFKVFLDELLKRHVRVAFLLILLCGSIVL
jgi:hypothetical protein